MGFIDDIFGPPSMEVPTREFFSWLVQHRAGSFGPQFSTRLLALSQDLRKVAVKAEEEKNPQFKKWCVEYADALEKVSKWNAAQSMAVIKELENLIGDNPAER